MIFLFISFKRRSDNLHHCVDGTAAPLPHFATHPPDHQQHCCCTTISFIFSGPPPTPCHCQRHCATTPAPLLSLKSKPFQNNSTSPLFGVCVCRWLLLHILWATSGRGQFCLHR